VRIRWVLRFMPGRLHHSNGTVRRQMKRH
jgi:hypothetical protein